MIEGENTERSHSGQSRVVRDQQGSKLAGRRASTREARRAGRGGARLGKKGELKGVEIKEGGGQPSKCPDCTTGKLPRTSFPTSTTRASAPLDRLSWVTLVKTKDEVAKVFKRSIRYAEREAGAKVKILRSDRGGEYMGKDLESFLEEKGITHQLSVAYTPQQNGAAERLNRTLIDLARAMLAHAQLDHTCYKGWKKHGVSTVGSSLQDPYTSSIFEGAWEDPGEEVQEQQEEQKAAAPHHEESPTAGSTPDPNAPAHDPEQPQGQQQQQQEKPQQPPQQHTPPVLVGRWQQLLQQQLPKSPRSPMKRVTWREKLQSLEQGEASPLRRTTRISRPPERLTPSAQYACMHDHEVHDFEESMLVYADGVAHGLDFCLMGQVHEPKSVKEALSRP
ncbi:unnamed protein product [Closterium sp. NIES-53]